MTTTVLGISGSVRRPSRTTALTAAIVAAIDRHLDVETRLIELADAAPVLFGALTRAEMDSAEERIIEAVETADILVVATPVYRASYTGALKHLFDLVRHDALAGKPVILAATGGSKLHGLVTEHQLRPLLSFFGALTIPTAIYATEADFDGHALTSAAVFGRIARAVQDLVSLVEARPLVKARSLVEVPPVAERALVAARS